MAVPELDIPQLSSFCSIPASSVNTLLDAPTADLVRSLLQNISVKVREYDELNSEKLRSNVELEAAVRGQETKNRALKSQLDKSHNEVSDLQQKLQAEEAARVSVESELQELRASTSTSTSDIQSLRARIESLEVSNRDTLSLLDSKNTAFDNLTNELNSQHEKTVELRRQVSTLEQSLQEKQTALSTASFREENQKQSIAQLERRNDFVENELKAKVSEHTRFRKDKSQQINQLERQNEEDATKIRQLQNTEANLRRTLEEVSEKADERSQRIQNLQEDFSHKENAFQLELDSANRLAKLRENSANTERARARDLDEQLEDLKQKASVEIGQIQAELDTEHNAREAAEARIGELDIELENLRESLVATSEPERGLSTPHRGMNGFSAQFPSHGSTTPQTFSPMSSNKKGNISVTQLVSETNELKRQLKEERRKSEQFSNTIDELMVEMENQSPEIEELRKEHARLQGEIAEMSLLIENVSRERDQAIKGAKKQEGQVEAKAKEGEVLRQQLRDLSSQIKMLLLEAHLRDQDQTDLSAGGRAQLERLARGDSDSDGPEGVTATDQFISANLVSFRNIVELQEQNSKLLKVTREIGEHMEQEEAKRKSTEAAHDWDDLQQKYERCKDEIQSLVTQSQSYIRERDMFRQMLGHRGALPQGVGLDSTPGGSINADGHSIGSANANEDLMDSIEGDPSGRDTADYAKLLKDMQAHFDAYRTETATDRATMKEQIDQLSKSNNQLRADSIRSNSQATLTHERYDMLQANYDLLKRENSELQKRTQSSFESAAKQDLRVQQAVEDLVEARGLIDSMRNETANLKAEKEFWKSVEKRINDDNENLINERGRLNALNASLQSLLNEREHSESETRRRLQAQVDSLESQLQKTSASLREEIEEGKRSASRREYEQQQSQKRIDDLVTSLGTVREDLAKSNAAKDHLTRQVDELTIELRSAKERLEVLQSANPRTSGREPASGNEDGTQELNISQEQELGVRVSELQRDLDLANKEIEELKSQVGQYKEISQASEDELNSLNETQDLYRQENDRLVAEKDAKIRSLQQRIEDNLAELASTNAEIDGLRTTQAEHDRKIEEQRKDFETRQAQLQDEHDRHAAAAQYYQQDLKAQANIAQQAQQNYENELVKHADAAKALQKVRGELGEVKLELVEARTEAETARLNLSQSEDSWTDSKERFEREISELRTARQDLKTQNDRLHQQLETLTLARKRTGEGQEQVREGSPGTGSDNLQEIVKFLRQEKQIVDLQLDLSAQEAKRLKQQLDYVQSQLDDSRLKLNQQRRIEADSERSSLDHNKLMETIHDLNTHRESNVTLRAEARQAQAALAARTKEVDELRTQLEPLQEEVLELKGEREAHESEVRLLKENADRWQQRAQNVLQKYDRVDPAEFEALKEQVKSLETERGELLSSKQALQEQLDLANGQINQVQEQSNERVEQMKARLTEQFKGRSKTLTDRIREKDTAIQTAFNEKEALEERVAGLSVLQAQLNTAKAERDAALEKAARDGPSPKSNVQTNDQVGGEEGELDESTNTVPNQAAIHALHPKVDNAERNASRESVNNANLLDELKVSKARIAELEAQITQLQTTNESLGKELSELHSSHQQTSEPSSGTGLQGQMDVLRRDLDEAKQDAENLRTAATVNASLAASAPEDGSKSVADQVAEHAEAVRKELERRHDERVKQIEDNFNKRAESMRAQLSKKLTESKEKQRQEIRQEVSVEHEQAMQSLKTEHGEAMEQLRIRHSSEIEELKRHEEAKLSELKASQGQQGQMQTPDGVANSPKLEKQPANAPWQPSAQEARAFIQTNEVVRGIVKQNIINQVNKQKEELTARLKGDHEKALKDQLADAQAKAKSAKEHAVMMEGKKTALQVNMANNKFKISQFKIDLVQRAAHDTPQKPVKEVWDAAKDAKPPQAPPSQQALQSPSRTSTSGPSTSVSTSRPPTPSKQTNAQGAATQGAAVVDPKAATSNAQGALTQGATPGQAKPASPNSQVVTAQAQTNGASQSKPAPSNADGAAAATGLFGKPTPTRLSPQPQPPQTQGQQNTNIGSTQPATGPVNPFQRQAPSGIPQRQPSNAANQANAATGLGALKPLQSGLPVARGGAPRGNPRGRGVSGIGRGGPGVDTSRAQGPPQGRGSPTSAGLNANARQFVPGNKRPREESQDGAQGGEGAGKRIRGGGAGS